MSSTLSVERARLAAIAACSTQSAAVRPQLPVRDVACVGLVLGLWSLGSSAAPQSEPLVNLTAAYVERFVDACANVVAEGAYTQERNHPRGRRTLRSHFVQKKERDAS